ncbi:zinc-binding dehydrogenase [Microbacterium sp. SS28]|uniref:zinc-dependent alcohol dehydrogenase n=1 Tax=Microbacterium sp. SS28 TaxID=2919948 RepID=UPI001FAA7200|nr:alcohol dehydrogenase catalytic domain-containing protein [Microbacterium sp. SS28]
MKALVISGPHRATVEDIEAPVPGPGEVVVDVQRAGICGTDIELFTGEMQYLHDGNASYPIRIGHEWMGTVASVAEDVDASWIGRRVTGDTMIGCGVCDRCRTGFHHVCDFRFELGIRGGKPGALAEQVAVPARSLHPLPDTVDDAAGAMVEPGGNAWRSVDGAQLRLGDRALILGPGTIGLLCAMFARAAGAEVHLMGRPGRSLEFARSLGWDGVWAADELPDLPWNTVIDSSNAPELPARALELVEPGRRIVHVGLAGSPSYVDTRIIALRDVTAVGILGASAGLAPTIAAYADASVDPRPLISTAVTLAELPEVLAGHRPAGAGPGPKIHVDITAS